MKNKVGKEMKNQMHPQVGALWRSPLDGQFYDLASIQISNPMWRQVISQVWVQVRRQLCSHLQEQNR